MGALDKMIDYSIEATKEVIYDFEQLKKQKPKLKDLGIEKKYKLKSTPVAIDRNYYATIGQLFSSTLSAPLTILQKITKTELLMKHKEIQKKYKFMTGDISAEEQIKLGYFTQAHLNKSTQGLNEMIKYAEDLINQLEKAKEILKTKTASLNFELYKFAKLQNKRYEFSKIARFLSN